MQPAVRYQIFRPVIFAKSFLDAGLGRGGGGVQDITILGLGARPDKG